MTFTEAAAEVLRLAGKPLHYKEITELAIEKNLLSHVGKSPEVTMGARLAALLKKEDKTNPIVRVKPGVFALREWSEAGGRKGKRGKVEEAEVAEDNDEGTDGINALEVEAAAKLPDTRGPVDDDDDDQPIIVSGEDALRADLAASGADLFDDEDDDDQPIFAEPRGTSAGGAAGAAGAGAAQAGGPGSGPISEGEGGRRRRRRRRRGRGGGANPAGAGPGPIVEYSAQPIQPSAIISVEGDSQIDVTRDPLSPSRPVVRDRSQIMGGGPIVPADVPLGEGDELAGKELADAVAIVLGAFDRNAGPVGVRNLVDALMRKGRLTGDPAGAATQLSASVRADNLRRSANGQRPRFRFGNGQRIALTDWALGPDLARLELDVMAAIERYRETARRTMLRRLQELPGHAFMELALFALERAGMVNIRAVRRAGSPGGEAHFAAIHKTGADEIRTAIILRKDGREIGRERVTDLRGALHHYGPASAGWLITTGQVLSGAREEAAAPNAPPIALYDGVSFARLLEDNDVGVIKTRFPIAIPDLELLENLRGG
jgi:HB1, ASXL, restriction endonuclease HTH domain/Restriction endonuclease